ncbi:MAG: TonB-dependent receptor plug domain-containing protein, partial [Dokdonella sp.]
MSHSSSVSCSAAVCIVAVLTVASAPVAASAPHTLERVQITATRSDELALEVPVAVTVIDQEEILRRVPQTGVDLLHGEPGTYVQQTTPGQGVVIIRGLKGSEVLHLVDGFRLNNAFFRNAPNQYLALVDPLNLERVEAVRGPMSTLYGSDAMGGVVQFLTPEPRFNGADWSSRGLLRARYSSGDRSDHTRAAFAFGREGFGLSGGVSHQQVRDRRVGGGERLPYTDYSQRSADLKLLLTPASGHELMLSLQTSEQPKTPRHDALVPGFGQSIAESDEFWFMPQEREFAQLRYRYQQPLVFADSIELQLGQQKIVDARTTRDHAAPYRDRERNRSTLRGFTAQANKALAGAHMLTWGVEYYTD